MSIKPRIGCPRATVGIAIAFLSLSVGVAAAPAPINNREPNTPLVDDAPAALPQETIDQYARRLLEQRLADPAATGQPQQRGHTGKIGPAQFELIYIAGVGKDARALVRIDKRYAKLAGGGDALAEWTLSHIGGDYVDIYKDDEQARIYLFSSRLGTGGG